MELELEPLESASFSASRDTVRKKSYTGFEKRIKNRRVNEDRRDNIRFGAEKTDRRDGKDRRCTNQDWKYSL